MCQQTSDTSLQRTMELPGALKRHRLNTDQRGACVASPSKGERRVAGILTAAGVDFDAERSFSDLRGVGGRPLRFDFIVHPHDGRQGAIEVQGKNTHAETGSFGHYSHRVASRGLANDKRKERYCAARGIPLLKVYPDGVHRNQDAMRHALESFLHQLGHREWHVQRGGGHKFSVGVPESTQGTILGVAGVVLRDSEGQRASGDGEASKAVGATSPALWWLLRCMGDCSGCCGRVWEAQSHLCLREVRLAYGDGGA